MARQHDAHVRSRKALARRVVNRRLEWGTTFLFTLKDMKRIGWDRLDELLMEAAYDAIAAYVWPKGWGDKLSTYHPYGPRQVVIGIYADVPTSVVHSIMCNLSDYFKPRLAAEKAKRAAARAAEKAKVTAGQG